MFRVTRRFHVLKHLRQRGDIQSETSSSLNRGSKSRFSRMSFRRLTSRSKSRSVRISSPLQVTRETDVKNENDDQNLRTHSRSSASVEGRQSNGIDTVDDGVVYATICHDSFGNNKNKSTDDNKSTRKCPEEVIVRRRPSRRHQRDQEDENNTCSDASCSHASSDVSKHKRRVVFLEKQVLH